MVEVSLFMPAQGTQMHLEPLAAHHVCEHSLNPLLARLFPLLLSSSAPLPVLLSIEDLQVKVPALQTWNTEY